MAGPRLSRRGRLPCGRAIRLPTGVRVPPERSVLRANARTLRGPRLLSGLPARTSWALWFLLSRSPIPTSFSAALAQFFQVYVAFHAAHNVGADLALVPQGDDGVALGIEELAPPASPYLRAPPVLVCNAPGLEPRLVAIDAFLVERAQLCLASVRYFLLVGQLVEPLERRLGGLHPRLELGHTGLVPFVLDAEA